MAAASLANVDWATLGALLLSFLTAAYGAYQKGVNTGVKTATVPAQPAAPAPEPVIVPVQTSTVPVQPATTTAEGSIIDLGFTVIPAFQEGASPYTAKFTLIGSQLVTDYVIDFQDGSPVQAGPFYPAGQYNIAIIDHVFTYAKGNSKYSGHSFYPIIMINGKNEAGGKVTNTFNTEKKGRCLSIIVNA